MDPVVNGALIGTRVQNKRIEVIVIDLFGFNKDKYDIIYRSHIQDVGWMNLTRNGKQTGIADGEKPRLYI